MTSVGSRPPSDEMHIGLSDAVAREWATWSRTLGLVALPHLQALQEDVPTLRAGMLCTLDGLNLAAVGVDEADVGRLAAIGGSLFATGGALRGVVDPRSEGASTLVNVVADDLCVVLTRIDVQHIGHLVLMAAADEVTLGVLIVAARQAGDRFRRALEG